MNYLYFFAICVNTIFILYGAAGEPSFGVQKSLADMALKVILAEKVPVSIGYKEHIVDEQLSKGVSEGTVSATDLQQLHFQAKTATSLFAQKHIGIVRTPSGDSVTKPNAFVLTYATFFEHLHQQDAIGVALTQSQRKATVEEPLNEATLQIALVL